MELIFLSQKADQKNLKSYYHRAITESKELYIVSAYLTNWDIEEKLGSHCEQFMMVVGQDFGLTRKVACESVLKWLPIRYKAQFFAAEGVQGFHPKAMFWRETDDKCYALIGSSNLSVAAFTDNHEINGITEILETTFQQSRAWVLGLEPPQSVVVDAKWLEGYVEATRQPKPSKRGAADEDSGNYSVEYVLPLPIDLEMVDKILRSRRAAMRVFKSQRDDLEKLFRDAAGTAKWSSKKNLAFYDTLCELWSMDGGSRFQAKGWEIKGKHCDHRELSKSLVRVMDSPKVERDSVVIRELNRMSDISLATRGSLFTEMLCQFFPSVYHVANSPIKDWLRASGLVR
ncbi:phospholipase D family protein [Pseudomonas putida]|uniref:Phospholipase D-like domain-containing protein n=1 Tax=Pseudomonas putida TaxID=303 RepID=A0A6I6XHI3_PSEPU|nr:phospholipase D family protein [Pseudomonas putida]QHG65210.1 hypothetical protein C2H86_12635 [Pseudomonas putida]